MMFKRSILAMCACTGMTFICAALGGRTNPLHRWMFEEGESALKLEGARFAEADGYGRCLSFSRASDRAVAEVGETVQDIPSAEKPYTIATWLKPDAGLVDDVAVFDQPLSSAELSVFLTSTNRIKSAK